jgi:phosphoribosylformylglycinamidine synthase
VATGRGATIDLPAGPDGLDAATVLFSESAARMLVTVAPGDEAELARRCAEAGQPAARLGEVGGDALVIEGVEPLPLAELRALGEATLPAVLD